jgi:membrane protein DedA with SNARE-associated domain
VSRLVTSAVDTADAPQTGLAGWVVEVVDALGGPGVGLLVFLENLFPPIPSEVVLPLAGFAAAQGAFSVVEAVLWATAGSVLGALVLYGIGAVVGTERLAAIADRVPLTSGADVYKADAWFDRRGPYAVFFGRLVPGVRSLISIPAGVTGMPLVRFTVLTTVGSALWNVLLVGAGYLLGSQWTRVEGYLSPVSRVVLVVLVLAFAAFLVHRAVTRRRARRTSG